MRLSWATMALAAVMAGGLMAPTAIAQQLTEDVRVDINLKDADMVTATRMLTQQTGLQFVVEPSNEPFGRITLKLDNASAEDAIRYICQSAGAFFRRDENGVFVISRTPPVVERTSTPQSTRPVKILKRIRVLKADPRMVYEQIRGTMNPEEYGTRGFMDLRRFSEAVQPPSPRMIGGNATFLPGPGNASPMGSQAFNTPINSVDGGNGISLPGEAAGQRGGGGGALGGGGGALGGGGGQLGGGGGQLGGGGGIGGGGGGQGSQLEAGQGLVGGSIDYISYDPTDNSIIVRGTEEDIAELQRYVSMFDVAPRQVIIKVEFITTSSSISRSLGFDFLYQRGQIFFGNRPGSFARVGDPIFLNYATGNVTMRMRTLLQEGYGRVVNAPIIRTLNNQPASVISSIQTWIFINTVVSSGLGQVITVPQIVQIPINTGLSVAPRINDDGTITLFLQPQISDLGQLRRGPQGEEVPDILTQAISVVARVRNGETIVLGGLTRKAEQGSQARFPILGDLPIIGQFFRSATRERNNSELLIFVTPRVVDEDDGLPGGL
jgi:general secretion pathway protein D